jgi:hypothetical protein
VMYGGVGSDIGRFGDGDYKLLRSFSSLCVAICHVLRVSFRGKLNKRRRSKGRKKKKLTTHPLNHDPLARPQKLNQLMPMRHGNNPVLRSVQDQYPLPTDLISNFAQLLCRLVVPAHGYQLHQETRSSEFLLVELFRDFLRRKARIVALETLVWPPSAS